MHYVALNQTADINFHFVLHIHQVAVNAEVLQFSAEY